MFVISRFANSEFLLSEVFSFSVSYLGDVCESIVFRLFTAILGGLNLCQIHPLFLEVS